MGNKLVWRRSSSDDSHPNPIDRKRKLDDLSGVGSIMACTTTSYQRQCHSKPMYKRRRVNDQFERLPEDVLCIILSKLPLKEVVRTSVLSTKWKHLWTVCPKLSFDGITICGNVISGAQKQQYVQKFIDNVNAVLQQHHGKGVEELAVKFGFDPMLIGHLNNWVRFAVSSRIKFLALHLVPDTFGDCDDRYVFPFQLLDNGSISGLQHIQLSFVCFTLPSQFRGFPNLRKLDLHMVHASGKDLQVMLLNCCNLEWLSTVKCHLNGELKVDHPLPKLQYLNVKYCDMTKVELHAIKLTTFVYKGLMVPIDLSKALELENVHIGFCSVTLEHVITAFPKELPNMQSLTLNAVFKQPKIPYLIENPCKFSHMKHLRLLLTFLEDVNMSLVSIMRAAPFMEKLEMHFSVCAFFYADEEPLMRLPEHLYSHLKDVRITGFVASKGQLEFLVHVAENAPALEVLTIDVTNIVVREDPWADSEKEAIFVAAVHSTARSHVAGKISPKCCLRLL